MDPHTRPSPFTGARQAYYRDLLTEAYTETAETPPGLQAEVHNRTFSVTLPPGVKSACIRVEIQLPASKSATEEFLLANIDSSGFQIFRGESAAAMQLSGALDPLPTSAAVQDATVQDRTVHDFTVQAMDVAERYRRHANTDHLSKGGFGGERLVRTVPSTPRPVHSSGQPMHSARSGRANTVGHPAYYPTSYVGFGSADERLVRPAAFAPGAVLSSSQTVQSARSGHTDPATLSPTLYDVPTPYASYGDPTTYTNGDAYTQTQQSGMPANPQVPQTQLGTPTTPTEATYGPSLKSKNSSRSLIRSTRSFIHDTSERLKKKLSRAEIHPLKDGISAPDSVPRPLTIQTRDLENCAPELKQSVASSPLSPSSTVGSTGSPLGPSSPLSGYGSGYTQAA